jgi:hypothetical protein
MESRKCIVCLKLWPIKKFNPGAVICHACAGKEHRGPDRRTWSDRKLCKGCGRTTFLYGEICETCKQRAEAKPVPPKPKEPKRPKRPHKAALIKRLVRPGELRDAFFEWYGAHCRVCGEGHPECLSFHHVDPKTKSAVVSSLWKEPGAEHVLAELPKCVLICRNCHARVHAKTLDISAVETVDSDSFAIYARKSALIEDVDLSTKLTLSQDNERTCDEICDCE